MRKKLISKKFFSFFEKLLKEKKNKSGYQIKK